MSVVCPNCERDVGICFTIPGEKPVDWAMCSCQTVFRQGKVDKKVFDAAYAMNALQWQHLEEYNRYFAKTYGHLIEELTYGRDMLNVGGVSNKFSEIFGERGWNVETVDLIPGDGSIIADIESWKPSNRYDFIMMPSMIGSLDDPTGFLVKCSLDMLNKDGVLFISAPDSTLIYERGVSEFGNWDDKENWVILSRRAMCETIERVGMNVIMSRANVAPRFIQWNDYHIIAQK